MALINHKALVRAMDLAGVTPTQMANRLNITTSYMARICKGERQLRRNPVLRAQIAKELGVPRKWIEIPEDTVETRWIEVPVESLTDVPL